MKLQLQFPYRLRHCANANMNWRARAGLAARVRKVIAGRLLELGKRRPSIPCKVTLTRGAPRKYDPDNLIHAFKHVVDEIAKWIGIDDRHSDKVRYVCEQHQTRAGVYFVRITFEDMQPGDRNETANPDDGTAA
jgi:hypothetical protein